MARDSYGITVYTVFFPGGYTITLSGSSSCSQFCAYHSTLYGLGTDTFYTVMPDLHPPSACSLGCGSASSVFDNVTSVLSHELAEVITDPDVALAAGYGPPLAWYDSTGSNGEIGDICNAQQTSFTGSDGKLYVIQKLFSNSQNDCVGPYPTIVNDFSLNANPTTITMAPTGSGSSSIGSTVTSGNQEIFALSVSGLPPGVTFGFNSSSVISERQQLQFHRDGQHLSTNGHGHEYDGLQLSNSWSAASQRFQH